MEWVESYAVGTLMVLAALAWAYVPVRRNREEGRVERGERARPGRR